MFLNLCTGARDEELSLDGGASFGTELYGHSEIEIEILEQV